MLKTKLQINDLIGKPFKWMGRGPDNYDCYGLVMEVSKRLGNPLPDYKSFIDKELRHKYIERNKKDFIEVDKPERGIVVTFRLHPVFCTHIGIMLDNYRFIHILRKKRVAIERIDNIFWRQKIDGFYKFRGENKINNE